MRQRCFRTTSVLLVIGFFLWVPVSRGAEGLTAQQGDAILNELKEIRVLLKDVLTQRKIGRKGSPRSAALPADAVVSIKNEPAKGQSTAKVTIVEFSDYQCPYCSRYTRQTLPKLEEDYIKTGKVKYVFKDFPLEQIHPKAIQAAGAANCAGNQAKYWEMHDLLFANQKAVNEADLENYAKKLDLKLEAFQECLKNGVQQTEIRGDVTDGSKLTVRGTPTFFIGLTDPDSSEVKVAHVLRGAQPYARFKALLDPLFKN